MIAEGEAGGGGGPEPPGAAVMKLDQFLKWTGVVGSGGQAKVLIRSGAVRVNGEAETRRGRKLRNGDRVEVEGRELVVGEAGRDAASGGAGK